MRTTFNNARNMLLKDLWANRNIRTCQSHKNVTISTLWNYSHSYFTVFIILQNFNNFTKTKQQHMDGVKVFSWLTSENEKQNEAKHSRNQHHTGRHDYCSTASQLISCSHQTVAEHTRTFIKDKTLRQIHSIWHI